MSIVGGSGGVRSGGQPGSSLSDRTQLPENDRIRKLEGRRVKAQADVDESRELLGQGHKAFLDDLKQVHERLEKLCRGIQPFLGPEYVAGTHAEIAAVDAMRMTSIEGFAQIRQLYEQAVRELAAIESELIAAKQLEIAEKQAAAAEEQTRLAAKQTDLAAAQTRMNRIVGGFVIATCIATAAQAYISWGQAGIANDALVEARRAAAAAEEQAKAPAPVLTCTVEMPLAKAGSAETVPAAPSGSQP